MSKGDDHEHSASCDHGNGHDSHGHDSAADSHGHDDHGHGGHAAPADAAPEHDLLTKALAGAAAILLIGIMGWWMTVPYQKVTPVSIKQNTNLSTRLSLLAKPTTKQSSCKLGTYSPCDNFCCLKAFTGPHACQLVLAFVLNYLFVQVRMAAPF